MSRRVARRAQSKLQGEVKESRRVSATNRRQETPGQVKSRSKAAGRALEQRITFESVGGSNKKAERKKKMGEEGKHREMRKSREGDEGGDEGREGETDGRRLFARLRAPGISKWQLAGRGLLRMQQCKCGSTGLAMQSNSSQFVGRQGMAKTHRLESDKQGTLTGT